MLQTNQEIGFCFHIYYLDEIVGELCDEFSKYAGRSLLLERAIYGLATNGNYWLLENDCWTPSANL